MSLVSTGLVEADRFIGDPLRAAPVSRISMTLVETILPCAEFERPWMREQLAFLNLGDVGRIGTPCKLFSSEGEQATE
jgi:hypothetical protein